MALAPDELVRKLSIKSGQRIIVRHCPDEFHDVFKQIGAAFDRGTIAEITLSFVRMQSEVDNACKEAIALTAPGGVLWMAYPEKTGNLTTDLTHEDGWQPFARAGWLPVSKITLDSVWSALRFHPVEHGRP